MNYYLHSPFEQFSLTSLLDYTFNINSSYYYIIILYLWLLINNLIILYYIIYNKCNIIYKILNIFFIIYTMYISIIYIINELQQMTYLNWIIYSIFIQFSMPFILLLYSYPILLFIITKTFYNKKYNVTFINYIHEYLSLINIKSFFYEFSSFLGKNGTKYLSYLIYLFISILIFNIIGILPYSLAITSYLFITFSLAIISWLSILLIGIHLYKIKYYKLYIPKGVPLFIVPLLISIELISNFFRMFSLSIRLFANILAGHVILELIVFVTYNMTIAIDTKLISNLSIVSACIPLFILFALSNAEAFVAFLQAYIFTILVSIYIGEITYPA